jgi:hypothetical protein
MVRPLSIRVADAAHENMNRNPGGIRFGSAEIYQVLESCFGEDQGKEARMTILDSLVVGQLTEGGSDERVICFVKLPEGAALSDQLRRAIGSEVRAKRTARHVPAEVRRTLSVGAAPLHQGMDGPTDRRTARRACCACIPRRRLSKCVTYRTR